MPIPPVTHPCWNQLVKVEVPNFQTNHIALKFLLKKLQGSATRPDVAAAELRQFFVKYERLLGKELSLLPK